MIGAVIGLVLLLGGWVALGVLSERWRKQAEKELQRKREEERERKFRESQKKYEIRLEDSPKKPDHPDFYLIEKERPIVLGTSMEALDHSLLIVRSASQWDDGSQHRSIQPKDSM